MDRISAGGINEGFLRSDSKLAIVGISDGDRSCVSDHNWLSDTYCSDAQIGMLQERMKSYLDLLVQSGKTQGYTVDFVINKSSPVPSANARNNQSGVLAYPYTYLSMAEYFGTEAIDIKSNFAPALVNLGGNIASGAQLTYQLTQQPESSDSIIVKIDGAALNINDGSYSYNSVQNKVVLSQATYDASRGKTLTIEYTSVAQ